MKYNLLQKEKDFNEVLLTNGNISFSEYMEYEKHLEQIENLYIINLN